MDLQRALENPRASFASPSEVVANDELSRAQKVQILKRWAYDARLIEVAQEENMMGGASSGLAEVLNALHALGEEATS